MHPIDGSVIYKGRVRSAQTHVLVSTLKGGDHKLLAAVQLYQTLAGRRQGTNLEDGRLDQNLVGKPNQRQSDGSVEDYEDGGHPRAVLGQQILRHSPR